MCRPESVPTLTDRLCAIATDIATVPLRAYRATRAVAGVGIRFTGFTRSPERQNILVPFAAPPSRFNGRLTPERAVAFCSLPIDDVRAVRKVHGVTFNDVVLGTCTGALRRSLLAHGVEPTRPLIAQIPVGVHRDTRADTTSVSGNFFSAMAALLPVQLADPAAQLQAIRESTRAAKAMHRVLGDNFLLDIVDLAPPAAISAAVHAYTALQLDRIHPPIFNVLVSNVPGSPIPVYSAGAKLRRDLPARPIARRLRVEHHRVQLLRSRRRRARLVPGHRRRHRCDRRCPPVRARRPHSRRYPRRLSWAVGRMATTASARSSPIRQVSGPAPTADCRAWRVPA